MSIGDRAIDRRASVSLGADQLDALAEAVRSLRAAGFRVTEIECAGHKATLAKSDSGDYVIVGLSMLPELRPSGPVRFRDTGPIITTGGPRAENRFESSRPQPAVQPAVNPPSLTTDLRDRI